MCNCPLCGAPMREAAASLDSDDCALTTAAGRTMFTGLQFALLAAFVEAAPRGLRTDTLREIARLDDRRALRKRIQRLNANLAAHGLEVKPQRVGASEAAWQLTGDAAVIAALRGAPSRTFTEQEDAVMLRYSRFGVDRAANAVRAPRDLVERRIAELQQRMAG